MRKQIFGMAMIFIASLQWSFAQPVYSGHFSVASLYGESKTKFQVQTIHGISMSGWFTGVGVAIDDYFQESVPIFLDLRKDILRTPRTPFVYADAGVNFLERKSQTEFMKRNLESGPYYDVGAGFKLFLGGRLDANISVGYSYKYYTENMYYRNSQVYLNAVTRDDWTNSVTQKYSLKRFALRVGLQF